MQCVFSFDPLQFQNALDKLIRERRAKNLQHTKLFHEVKKSRWKTFTEY
jgi:hypothetical protein